MLLVIKSQRSGLVARHAEHVRSIQSQADSNQKSIEDDYNGLSITLQSSIQRRIDSLVQSHDFEFQSMASRHEEEEDETFLTLARHMKGKSNRDERERTILERLKTSHEKERKSLKNTHKLAQTDSRYQANLQAQALKWDMEYKVQEVRENYSKSIEYFAKTVMAERGWFDAVTKKRMEMIEQFKDDLINGRRETENEDSMPEIAKPVSPLANTDPKFNTEPEKMGQRNRRATFQAKPNEISRTPTKSRRNDKLARQSPFAVMIG